jgi:hypothetical protein
MPVLTLPISVFLSVLDNDPLATKLEWPGDLNEWREVTRKEAAPLWSPVTYREGKGREARGGTARNVESVHAVVLDYDGGGVTLEAAAAAWSAFEYACYTTYSHLLVKPPKYNGEPRFRIVLPLTRSITVAEFEHVWRWAHAFAADAADIYRTYRALDRLSGRNCAFLTPEGQVEGLVEEVDPLRGLRVRDGGGVRFLPAATTSVVPPASGSRYGGTHGSA